MKSMFFLFMGALINTSLLAQQPSAAVFMDGDISTYLNERDMAISPDGKEMFYTVQGAGNSFSVLIHRKKQGKQWSAPEVASFSGRFSDLEPAFNQDGSQLLFCSNRSLQGDRTKDYDIWLVNKTDGVWGSPQNVGEPVNTRSDEFYPSIAANGNLYYTAQYTNGIGKEDIFMSAFYDGKYHTPQPVDTTVNSPLWEFNAYVAPDESFILFSSCGREDDNGGCDLYVSLKDESGQWKPAVNLKAINSAALDYCPFVSFDRKILYFTSARHLMPSFRAAPLNFKEIQRLTSRSKNGASDIYYVDFQKLLQSIK